jgi:hypothetical protein
MQATPATTGRGSLSLREEAPSGRCKFISTRKEIIMSNETTFNLAEFEAEDTATLDVQNKKDDGPLLVDGQPVQIVLFGPGSAEFVRAEAKANQAAQARTFAALRGKPMKETPEEARQKNAEKLAACTQGFVNFPIEGGALALYNNPKLGYITAQVEKFLSDWGNF